MGIESAFRPAASNVLLPLWKAVYVDARGIYGANRRGLSADRFTRMEPVITRMAGSVLCGLEPVLTERERFR